MDKLYPVIIALVISILMSGWIHPIIVRIAKLKNIVDNPDARKLQREPVPVLGGMAVFFGIVFGLGSMVPFVDAAKLLVLITAAMAMLYTGTMDDILNLSPMMRVMIEVLVMLILILIGGYYIDDFHGLWGIETIPYGLAVPLTLFAAIGIINAINLIDGVNGLSSGFCIIACIMFGTTFYLSGDITMTIMAAVSAGALIPFFFHNVFGKTSKMFIGDGGTLVMGVLMSVFVFEMLHHNSQCAQFVGPKIGLVPFTLAVLSVPVFDTLRVMLTRLAHHTSPFRPDKTHLHHMFIELGYSHSSTTFAILTLNTIVVFIWWILAAAGASIDLQFYAVVGLSLLITVGLYQFTAHQMPRNTRFVRTLRLIGQRLSIDDSKFFLAIQKMIDKI